MTEEEIKELEHERDVWKERAYQAASPEGKCCCAEWDAQGFSVCGVPCPIHYENAVAKLREKIVEQDRMIKLQAAALDAWKDSSYRLPTLVQKPIKDG